MLTQTPLPASPILMYKNLCFLAPWHLLWFFKEWLILYQNLYRNKDDLAGFSYLFSRWLGQARAVISRILNKAYLNASTLLRDQNVGGGEECRRD
jgi:hypothetical protein